MDRVGVVERRRRQLAGDITFLCRSALSERTHVGLDTGLRREHAAAYRERNAETDRSRQRGARLAKNHRRRLPTHRRVRNRRRSLQLLCWRRCTNVRTAQFLTCERRRLPVHVRVLDVAARCVPLSGAALSRTRRGRSADIRPLLNWRTATRSRSWRGTDTCAATTGVVLQLECSTSFGDREAAWQTIRARRQLTNL